MALKFRFIKFLIFSEYGVYSSDNAPLLFNALSHLVAASEAIARAWLE